MGEMKEKLMDSSFFEGVQSEQLRIKSFIRELTKNSDDVEFLYTSDLNDYIDNNDPDTKYTLLALLDEEIRRIKKLPLAEYKSTAILKSIKACEDAINAVRQIEV